MSTEIFEMRKLVYGVGVNDAGYPTEDRKIGWRCPFYGRWKNMLKRCYSSSKRASYEGCTVSDEWLTFSNFKAWMISQDWEGKELDKDLLGDGKTYSSSTCVFIPTSVNGFLVDSETRRSKLGVGIQKKPNGKFAVRVRYRRSQRWVGVFESLDEATEAWYKAKSEIAEELALEIEDVRAAEALRTKYRRKPKNQKEGSTHE